LPSPLLQLIHQRQSQGRKREKKRSAKESPAATKSAEVKASPAAEVKAEVKASPAANKSPILAGIKQALEVVEKAGNFGFILLLCFFFCVVCLSLPTTPIELSAGFMYGPVWGCIAGVTGKTVGCFIAYLIAKFLGKRMGWTVTGFCGDKLDKYMGPLKTDPFKTMTGIRIAPLPLGLKNYGLALCEVPAIPYVLASIVVNVPFSMMWATLGASCTSLQDALDFDTSKVSIMGAMPEWARPVLAIVVVVAVGFFSLKFMVGKKDGKKE